MEGLRPKVANMTGSELKKSANIPEQLRSAHQKLEELTNRYILEILSSKESSEEYAKKLLTVLNCLGEGLLVFDKDMSLILANMAASKLAGAGMGKCSRDDLRATYQAFKRDGITPLSVEEEPLVIAMKERRAAKAELLIKSQTLPPDGLWVRVTAAPVIDSSGNLLGGVSVFQDISEQVALVRQRDALLSLITHDLKNHFAAEYSLVEYLLSACSEQLDSEAIELLKELQKSSRHYTDVGRTMLEVFRAELNDSKTSRADVDLEQTLRASLQLNSMIASSKNVKIDLVIDKHLPHITGIPSAWRQIFHNLIQNAVEASPPGQAVCVKATNSKGAVRICVEDKGCGMSKEEAKKFFDRTDIGNSTKSAHSTGVGLYLCRFLVEAHGGEISCKSEPNRGTTFSIDLPCTT